METTVLNVHYIIHIIWLAKVNLGRPPLALVKWNVDVGLSRDRVRPHARVKWLLVAVSLLCLLRSGLTSASTFCEVQLNQAMSNSWGWSEDQKAQNGIGCYCGLYGTLCQGYVQFGREWELGIGSCTLLSLSSTCPMWKRWPKQKQEAILCVSSSS